MTFADVTFVDAHVHVHAHSDVEKLLDAASHHFGAVAATIDAGRWDGVLMLCEMRGADWFESVAAGGGKFGLWSLAPTDSKSLSTVATSGQRRLTIIAGRQVATSEGIEVLALATRSRIADGRSLAHTLQVADQAQALVVLPWAVGKWFGARGRLVGKALGEYPRAPFAGDNGGRPNFWPTPASFEIARRRGRPVLNGSDPLPLPGEERRVGSFGFWLQGGLDTADPAPSLRTRLLHASTADVHAFGRLQGMTRFVRNQAGLRMRKKAA